MDSQLLFSKDSIGIFDSGVGGLSVLNAFQKINPGYPVIYFADQNHVPYGPRPIEQIREFSFKIADFLIGLGAKLIVVACNTASAAALHHLRIAFPSTKFVGMEPAVKPAAEITNSGVVGVLATPATFEGKLYNSVVERFAKGVVIYQDTCPGLVQEIEKGSFDGKKTYQILENAILPMLDHNIDTLVLGCTHYPFVIPTIRKIAGNQVKIIDPAPAVAKQTLKQAETIALSINNRDLNPVTMITSGSINEFITILQKFCIQSGITLQAKWDHSNSQINLTQP